MGGALIKVDIGHGRGWLAPEPAASLARIDAQLGRLADINEAGRSPEQADENRRRWLAYAAYLNGGPWAPKAPYALGSDQSVHCWGYAADTDDSYNPAASAVWLRNGWVQTALYPNNPAKHEPWHREYRSDRDQHRNDPAPAGGGATKPKEWDEMATQDEIMAGFRKIVKEEVVAEVAKAVKQYARSGAYKIVGVNGPASNPGPHMKLVGPEGETDLKTDDEVHLLRRHVQALPFVADQPWNPESKFVTGEERFTPTQWAIVSKVLARMKPVKAS